MCMCVYAYEQNMNHTQLEHTALFYSILFYAVSCAEYISCESHHFDFHFLCVYYFNILKLLSYDTVFDTLINKTEILLI